MLNEHGADAGPSEPKTPEFCVNPKLREYLSVAIPRRELVLKYLEEIASVFAPNWTAPDWCPACLPLPPPSPSESSSAPSPSDRQPRAPPGAG
jgi:hypothetical protein